MLCGSPTEQPVQLTADLQDVAELPVTEQAPTLVQPNPNREEGDGDVDSALDVDVASSTASLTESILRYRTLHGRTYQSSQTTNYWAPNDDKQNQGLDLFHNAVTMVLEDKLFLAPIGEHPKRALDVGTGTGIWAIDFADEFPEVEVTATDISPIQPTWVPPNLKFEIDDMNLDWTWPDNHFDFIHFRVLYGCVPSFEELYRKAFHHLRPNGWMQDLEMDTKLESDRVTLEEKRTLDAWGQLFIKAGEKTGCRFDIAREHGMKERMENVGFVDVVDRKIFIPCGSWPEEPSLRNASLLVQLAIQESLDGLAMYLGTQVLEWSDEMVTVLVAKIRNVVKRSTNCCYITATVAYGHKP